MPSPIEDYALLGDCRTAALVSRSGSIDWFCPSRFDADACFAALLGNDEHGRFLLKPVGDDFKVSRRYLPDTMVLETTFSSPSGTVHLVDFMPLDGAASNIVRLVVGVSGQVEMEAELVIRFDYGLAIPWVEHDHAGVHAIAGPDELLLVSLVDFSGENFRSRARFKVSAHERVPFVLSWFRSYEPTPPAIDAEAALRETTAFWQKWASQVGDIARRDLVVRSLLTLKALTHSATGGMVAAATTSLPEAIGGKRNWDYRYCWLRDATFTLHALLNAGFHEEARAWQDWLIRAAAGEPSQLQVMYGVAGERRLPELELSWLPGYQGSKPVRIGNQASEQLQLDIYGEIIGAFYLARRRGLPGSHETWALAKALAGFVADNWNRPDSGIWEMRGPARHFTHSKVMAWVAIDRVIQAVEQHGRDGPVASWRALRDRIRETILTHGFNQKLNSFTQYFDGVTVDASLLLLPMVGFVPATDPRMRGTVAQIEKQLFESGFILRYRNEKVDDGLPPGEGAFIACTFWYVDVLILQGRHDEASAIFNDLAGLANDVGLYSEEYDFVNRRQLGNFPQAFSHVALINTAENLARGSADPAHLQPDGDR